MAKFKVKVEDATYRVDAPDENTAWDWANQTHSQGKASSPDSKSTPVKPTSFTPTNITGTPGIREKIDQFIAGLQGEKSAGARFIRGQADLPIGVTQKIAHAVSPEAGEKVRSTFAGFTPQDEGFDFARLGGNLFNPVPWKAAEMLRNVPLVRRLLEAGIIGGSYAAGSPVDKPVDSMVGETIEQGGVGAVTGALLQPFGEAALKVGKGAYHLVEPFVQKGRDLVKGRLLNRLAGPAQADVINQLKTAQPDLPGSRLTAGEAAVEARSPEFSAAQRVIDKAYPKARLDIDDQTARARTHQEFLRDYMGDLDYAKAFRTIVRSDPELIAMSKNPYFVKAARDSTAASKAAGLKATDALERLHLVKEGLDKQLAQEGNTALQGTERRLALEAQKRLVDWMERKAPDYRAARLNYIDESRPFAKADERSAAFKDLAQRGQGAESVNELTDIVGKQLERATGMERLPGMLERNVLVINSLLRRIKGQANRKILNELAVDMQDPARAAQLMEQANLPPQQRALLEAVLQRTPAGLGVPTAEAIRR